MLLRLSLDLAQPWHHGHVWELVDVLFASLPSPKEEDTPETSLLGERSSSRSLHPFKSETANRVPDAKPCQRKYF